MTWSEVIPWFLVILAADIAADAFMQYVRKWRKARKKVAFDACDVCGKPRRVKPTKDLQKNCCRDCRKLYNQALVQEEIKQAES